MGAGSPTRSPTLLGHRLKIARPPPCSRQGLTWQEEAHPTPLHCTFCDGTLTGHFPSCTLNRKRRGWDTLSSCHPLSTTAPAAGFSSCVFDNLESQPSECQ